MHKERITIDMTVIEAVTAMSEGNPGAVNVLMQLMKETPKVDPIAFLGPLASLLSLDSLAVYGPRIWMLYKDVCHENIYLTIAVLRANQQGFITRAQLDKAIDNYGAGLELKGIMQKVRGSIGEFNVPAEMEV